MRSEELSIINEQLSMKEIYHEPHQPTRTEEDKFVVKKQRSI